MSTTRRTILTSLAALPAVIAPAALPALATGVADADLVAQAARVEALARRLNELWEIRSRRDDRAEALKPPEPQRPERSRPITTDVTHHEDGSVTILITKWAPTPEERAAKLAHKAATTAWEAECERIKRRAGLRAAERLCGRFDARLHDAAAILVDMRATSLRGLAAKARALEACNPDMAFSEGWMEQLTASILRDAIAMGGAT